MCAHMSTLDTETAFYLLLTLSQHEAVSEKSNSRGQLRIAAYRLCLNPRFIKKLPEFF